MPRRAKSRSQKSPGELPPLKLRAPSFLEHKGFLFILIVFLLLALLLFDPKPFLGGDNATYIILAKSLLSGRGYLDLSAPNAPPHKLYPPGYPLLLAPLLFLFPRFLLPFKFLSLVAASLSLYLSFRIFGCGSSGPGPGSSKETFAKNRTLGFSLAAFMAVNATYLEFSHWVLSEIPFLLASLWVLSLLPRFAPPRSPDWRDVLLLAVTASATYYVRSAGITLIFALFVFLLLRRRYRLALFFAALTALFLLPWQVRNWLVRIEGTTYLGAFFLRDPYNQVAGNATLSEVLARFLPNAKAYGLTILPQLLLSLPTPAPSYLISLPLLSLLFYGFVGRIRSARRVGAIEIYVLGTVLIALLWPQVWTDRRFLLPLLPFLLFYFLFGLRQLSRHVFKASGEKPFAFLVGLLIFLQFLFLLPAIPTNLRMISSYLSGDDLAGYPEPWVTFFQAADWVKANTEPTAVVISRKPTLFYLRAERSSFIYPFTPEPESLNAVINRYKADYILVDQVSGTTQRYLIPALRPGIPDRYELIHQTPEPATYILRVKRP